MKRSVKKYDAQLKAKLALELVSGKKTLIEICTEHKIPKTTLIEWKEKLEKGNHSPQSATSWPTVVMQALQH